MAGKTEAIAALYSCDDRAFRLAVEERLSCAISDAATPRGTGALARSKAVFTSSSPVVSHGKENGVSLPSSSSSSFESAVMTSPLEELLGRPGNPYACPSCAVVLSRGASSRVCFACGTRMSPVSVTKTVNWKGTIAERRFVKSFKLSDDLKDSGMLPGTPALKRVLTSKGPDAANAKGARSPVVKKLEQGLQAKLSPRLLQKERHSNNAASFPSSPDKKSPRHVNPPLLRLQKGVERIKPVRSSMGSQANGFKNMEHTQNGSGSSDFFIQADGFHAESPLAATPIKASLKTAMEIAGEEAAKFDTKFPTQKSPAEEAARFDALFPTTVIVDEKAAKFNALFPTLKREESSEILRPRPLVDIEGDSPEVRVSPMPTMSSSLMDQLEDLVDETEKFDGHIFPPGKGFASASAWRRASDFMVGMKPLEIPTLRGQEGFGSVYGRRWAGSGVSHLPHAPSSPSPALQAVLEDMKDLTFMISPRLMVPSKDIENTDAHVGKNEACSSPLGHATGQDGNWSGPSPKGDPLSWLSNTSWARGSGGGDASGRLAEGRGMSSPRGVAMRKPGPLVGSGGGVVTSGKTAASSHGNFSSGVVGDLRSATGLSDAVVAREHSGLLENGSTIPDTCVNGTKSVDEAACVVFDPRTPGQLNGGRSAAVRNSSVIRVEEAKREEEEDSHLWDGVLGRHRHRSIKGSPENGRLREAGSALANVKSQGTPEKQGGLATRTLADQEWGLSNGFRKTYSDQIREIKSSRGSNGTTSPGWHASFSNEWDEVSFDAASFAGVKNKETEERSDRQSLLMVEKLHMEDDDADDDEWTEFISAA